MSKGELRGNCNVTACQSDDDVTWWNHSTRKYYCKSCAVKLNKANKTEATEIYGHNLCTQLKEDREVLLTCKDNSGRVMNFYTNGEFEGDNWSRGDCSYWNMSNSNNFMWRHQETSRWSYFPNDSQSRLEAKIMLDCGSCVDLEEELVRRIEMREIEKVLAE